MIPRRTARAALLSLSLAAAAAGWSVADDPASAPEAPSPRRKIRAPYLESLLGSWDAAVQVPGGPAMRGRARFWMALDGTALAQDFVAGEDKEAFHGFGMWYVGADGTTLREWWFDSDGAGNVWDLTGTLSEEGYEVSSDAGGMKGVFAMKKEGDGHVFTMKHGDQTQATVTYTKAAAEHDWAPVSDALRIKQPLIEAEIGAWHAMGTLRMGTEAYPQEGSSTFRWIVGGAYVLQEYEIFSVLEHSFAFGISSVGAGGKSLKTWWFANSGDGPTLAEGPLTEKEWTGRIEKGPMGPVDLIWTRTDAGFTLRYKIPQAKGEGEETYTKK